MLARHSWEKFALAALVAVTGFRLWLSATLGLGDDEAYYWDWSRSLALSYFDHPPLNAWLIRASTAVFGDTPLGVRLPGQLCYAGSALLLWRLGISIYGRLCAAWALLFYLTAPIFLVGGLLMVPDAPLALAWIAAAFFLWRILGEGKNGLGTWLGLGACLGAGLLAKLPMLLMVGAMACLLAARNEWRAKIRGGRFWLAMAVALLGIAPTILWNAEHGAASFRFHLLERQSGGLSFTRWTQFFVSQLVALGPALFLLVLAAIASAAARFRDPRAAFLTWLSLPPLLLFTLQALFADFKPHWPAPAYPLLLLGAARLLESWSRGLQAACLALVFFSSALISGGAFLALLKPVAPSFARWISPAKPWDPKHDPTNELYGWEAAAAGARELGAKHDAFLATHRYQLAGQLAFAARERVWRIGPSRDHYSFAQKKEELEGLRGRGAILVGDNRFSPGPGELGQFAECVQLPAMEVYRGPELARRFLFWGCRGFRP